MSDYSVESELNRDCREFFRCPVDGEESRGTLQINGRRIPVVIQDKSIDGFSAVVEPKHVKRLRIGPKWVLRCNGETVEVWAQWMFHAPEGQMQVGLRRMRDLTRPAPASWLPTLTAYRKHTSNPEVLMGAVVLTLLLALSLPGIGDELGTTGVIQDGVRMVWQTISDSLSTLW